MISDGRPGATGDYPGGGGAGGSIQLHTPLIQVTVKFTRISYTIFWKTSQKAFGISFRNE